MSVKERFLSMFIRRGKKKTEKKMSSGQAKRGTWRFFPLNHFSSMCPQTGGGGGNATLNILLWTWCYRQESLDVLFISQSCKHFCFKAIQIARRPEWGVSQRCSVCQSPIVVGFGLLTTFVDNMTIISHIPSGQR